MFNKNISFCIPRSAYILSIKTYIYGPDLDAKSKFAYMLGYYFLNVLTKHYNFKRNNLKVASIRNISRMVKLTKNKKKYIF